MSDPDHIKLERGSTIALALGGGAVLGAAHVGVLRALEEHEINVGWISGTSIGALVASLYAFNRDCDAVADFAMHMTWGDISSFSLSRFGFFSNKKLKSLLRNQLGDATFATSKIPLAIVATNIETGQKRVLQEGSVAEAVVASMSIPGMFSPIEINGELLVDGGIVENVPISPLRAMEASPVVAVDLNHEHSYERPTNVLGVLLNSFHFTLATASRLQTDKADLLITPDLSQFNRFDTDQVDALIEKGYEGACKVLDRCLVK